MRDSGQAEVSLGTFLGLRALEQQQSCFCTRCGSFSAGGPEGQQCEQGTLGAEPRPSRQKQLLLGEGGDTHQVVDLKRLPSGGACRVAEALETKQSA